MCLILFTREKVEWREFILLNLLITWLSLLADKHHSDQYQALILLSTDWGGDLARWKALDSRWITKDEIVSDKIVSTFDISDVIIATENMFKK